MKILSLLIIGFLFANCGKGETVPSDILKKINETYVNKDDRNHVRKKIEELWKRPLTVGPAQLARAILILSGNDKEYFDKLIKDFLGDPRDVLVAAEEKIGNPGHFCTIPFDQMNLK